MSEHRTPFYVEAPQRLSVAQVTHIAMARLYARLGWPGCAGCLLALVAMLALVWVHRAQMRLTQLQQARQSTAVTTSATDREPATAPQRSTPPALPHGNDSVALLKRIEKAILASGLSWPQADYKQAPLSNESLATLEIRTTLKGPYPRLRQLITTLLNQEPALALRELNLSRPNGETPDVEAKVRWVVFLADGWAPAEAGSLQ
jgi:hypothetical protein